MDLTLTTEPDRLREPGHAFLHRTAGSGLHAEPLGAIRPGRGSTGSKAVGAALTCLGDEDSGYRLVWSSKARASARRHRCRRETEVLLAVRHAERDSVLLDGRRPLRSPS